MFDGRQIETAFEHDAVGREKVRIAAKNTPVEARTETDYDLVGNVTEVRSPRFYDSTDTHGHNKAKQTWTYTGRNLVASHTEAPGTPEAATESFVYLLRANGCY
jgi:hypothetical protein